MPHSELLHQHWFLPFFKCNQEKTCNNTFPISMAYRPSPSFPLRIGALGITSSITRQSWQRELLGALVELVVIVVLLRFTCKAVAFFLPQFTDLQRPLCIFSVELTLWGLTGSVVPHDWPSYLSISLEESAEISPKFNHLVIIGLETSGWQAYHCTAQESTRNPHWKFTTANPNISPRRDSDIPQTQESPAPAKCCPSVAVDSESALDPIFGRLEMTPAVCSSAAGYC